VSVLLIAHSTFPEEWRDAFQGAFREEGLLIWPEVNDPEIIDCAVVARPEPAVLSKLPNLKLISSTGMGVDHILALPDLPRAVPLARVVTAEMLDQVSEYATLAVLRVERDSDRFDQLQKDRKWERRMTGRPTGRLHVGLLGWGVIGREIARRLTFLGFSVQAWARSARTEAGVTILAGAEGLKEILAGSDILISALPNTQATRDILDAGALAMLPPKAHVVNVGRGEHIVEQALVAALDNGHLSGATLDVFRTEPLPADHPFWRHPKIRVTPHSAGLLSPADSAAAILNNLRRVRSGLAPENQVDPARGF
jgi:glyoxylate/hydroxypyruvate reductase